MALDSYDEARLKRLQPDEISDSLERGSIVYFPKSPVALPSEDDLEFFRQQLPGLLKRKNISYHPESDSTRGLESTDPAVTERVNRILKTVSADIASFLGEVAPRLTRNWTVGTCSFRPMEERVVTCRPTPVTSSCISMPVRTAQPTAIVYCAFLSM